MFCMRKVFITFEWKGDQHGEQPPSYAQVIPSDPNNLLRNIKRSINLDDLDGFSQLLKQDFIYAGCLKKKVFSDNHARGEWRDYIEETYRVRPTIEALFLEHRQVLRQIIQELISLPIHRLSRFYDALEKSFEDTDLAKIDIFKDYISLQNNLTTQLTELADYGTQLSQQGVIKGSKINDLVIELNQELDKIDTKETDNLKSKLNFLDFKLEFIDKLHQYDKEFAHHRGFIRIITNIAALIFAGIPNLVNKLVTGNWLFFNQTQTQKLIEKTEESLGMSIAE